MQFNNRSGMGEKMVAVVAGDASISRGDIVAEVMAAKGHYVALCMGPAEADRARYVALRDKIATHESRSFITKLLEKPIMKGILREFNAIPLEEKWVSPFNNVVCTLGKNDMLDKYLAGSSYTAAFYCGLISSVSYSAVAATDTAAQINGTNAWKEAGPTSAPNYSQSTRVAFTFASASGGSKATSAASSFSITATGTVKGCFAATSSAKDATTGVLLSAGLFTGGDKVVANGDTLNVSYSLSL